MAVPVVVRVETPLTTPDVEIEATDVGDIVHAPPPPLANASVMVMKLPAQTWSGPDTTPGLGNGFTFTVPTEK